MSSLDLFETKKRLTAWGNWCYKIITQGLGYSSHSLLAKLQAEGGMIIQGTAKMLLPSNEEAEEIDDLLIRLSNAKPLGEGKENWVKIIRIHYTMLDKTIKERIKTATVSERTYYRYLQEGEMWIGKCLMKS